MYLAQQFSVLVCQITLSSFQCMCVRVCTYVSGSGCPPTLCLVFPWFASHWLQLPPSFSRWGNWGLKKKKKNKVKRLIGTARTRTCVSSAWVTGQKPYTDSDVLRHLLGVSCCAPATSALSHWTFPVAWLPRRYRAVQRTGAVGDLRWECSFVYCILPN